MNNRDKQTLVFTLTMPKTSSWDGRWSQQNKDHSVVRRIPTHKATTIVDKSFRYDFGDGWIAQVAVRKAKDRYETKRVSMTSAGFCGYDWMIDEIINHGRILTLSERCRLTVSDRSVA